MALCETRRCCHLHDAPPCLLGSQVRQASAVMAGVRVPGLVPRRLASARVRVCQEVRAVLGAELRLRRSGKRARVVPGVLWT